MASAATGSAHVPIFDGAPPRSPFHLSAGGAAA